MEEEIKEAVVAVEKTKVKKEFIYPNKKQLEPLIIKYNINTNTSRNFKSIVKLFVEAPSYLPWAIKCVYNKVISISELAEIKNWIDANPTLIQLLAKQNIISYNSLEDVINLQQEMRIVQDFQIIKQESSKFNTVQRKVLLSTYTIEYMIDLAHNKWAEYSKLISYWKKFRELSNKRQNAFIRKASTIETGELGIFTAITKFIDSPEMTWTMEGMEEFIDMNCNESVIVAKGDNCVVIEVGSLNDSIMLGKHTPWCITKHEGGEGHWKNYISSYNGQAKQYFYFDFSLDKENVNACIGFTIHNFKILHDAHNNIAQGEKIIPPDYKKVESNREKFYIDEILLDKGIDKNQFLHFDSKEIAEFFGEPIIWTDGKITENTHVNELTFLNILHQENNIILAKINNLTDFRRSFNWVNNRTIKTTFIEGEPTSYVLFNMNIPITDIESIITWDVILNDYNTYSVYGFDADNYMVNMNKLPSKFNFSESLYIPKVEINNSMRFHKAIADKNVDEAKKLITTCDDIDVNCIYGERQPIFMCTMEVCDFELFKMIFEHPGFKVGELSSFGDTILTEIVLDYALCDNKEYYTKILNYILDKEDIDFNTKTYSNDTMLIIASYDNSTSWVVKRLLEKDSVDRYCVNDLGEDALAAACNMYDTEQCIRELLMHNVQVRQNKNNVQTIIDTNYSEFVETDMEKYIPSNVNEEVVLIG